jgi:tRNA pseudouridine38-40 synthase
MIPTQESASRNIMLVVSYDGTNSAGWQVQPNARTVQECLEAAIQKITGETVRVLCAGRTDSGVHAIGQVANFRTCSRIPASRFRAAIQAELPRQRDIVVLESREVAKEFHATYNAIRKTYRYLLFDGESCPPFLRAYVAYSRSRLDVSAMHVAAQFLLGTHDFRCFESHYPNKATSVRTIEKAAFARTPPWSPWSASSVAGAKDKKSTLTDSPLMAFEVTADGFLYNMVRAIVGTLQEIGEHKHPPDRMQTVIESQDRINAGMTAPAHGLYLAAVDYPASLLRPGGVE